MLRAVAFVALLHYAAAGDPGATLSGEPSALADGGSDLDAVGAAVAGRRGHAASRWVRVARPRPTEALWQPPPTRRASVPARPRWRRIPRLRSDGTGDA